jgi:hypothetical protein
MIKWDSSIEYSIAKFYKSFENNFNLFNFNVMNGRFIFLKLMIDEIQKKCNLSKMQLTKGAFIRIMNETKLYDDINLNSIIDIYNEKNL